VGSPAAIEALSARFEEESDASLLDEIGRALNMSDTKPAV
jgi:hypothetical protein